MRAYVVVFDLSFPVERGWSRDGRLLDWTLNGWLDGVVRWMEG
jgi:hypothetical protein